MKSASQIPDRKKNNLVGNKNHTSAQNCLFLQGERVLVATLPLIRTMTVSQSVTQLRILTESHIIALNVADIKIASKFEFGSGHWLP
jgi:hypothetical protein